MHTAREHYKDHPGGISYGEGNAFMHGLLSYLLTAELGEEVAKEITDANEVVPAGLYDKHHEILKKEPSLDALRRFFVDLKNFVETSNQDGRALYDKKADLYNNWHGREVFKQTKNLDEAIAILKRDAKHRKMVVPKIP